MAVKKEKNSFWSPSSGNWAEWLKADNGWTATDQSEPWEIVPEAYKMDDCDPWEIVPDEKKIEDLSFDEKEGQENLDLADETSDSSPWSIVPDEKNDRISANEGTENYENSATEEDDLTDQFNDRITEDIKFETDENKDRVDENDGPDNFADQEKKDEGGYWPTEDLTNSDDDLTDDFFDPTDCPAMSSYYRKPGNSKSLHLNLDFKSSGKRNNGKGKRKRFDRPDKCDCW